MIWLSMNAICLRSNVCSGVFEKLKMCSYFETCALFSNFLTRKYDNLIVLSLIVGIFPVFERHYHII